MALAGTDLNEEASPLRRELYEAWRSLDAEYRQKLQDAQCELMCKWLDAGTFFCKPSPESHGPPAKKDDDPGDVTHVSEPVIRFTGEFAFLSNFWPCRVELDGMIFPGVEQAFQAAKTLDPAERCHFVDLNPGAAKRAGRKVELRPDWQQVKVGIMPPVPPIQVLRPRTAGEASGDR